MKRALIYSIHRLYDWWGHIGRNMGFDAVTVLSDQRGKGDRSVTDDFYAAYRRFYAEQPSASTLLSAEEIEDVIARCRVLRWLPRRRSAAMAMAMAQAMETALDAERPDIILSFPIDSYVSDTLARRARARGIPYFELTASALPDMCMLMHRGRLITTEAAPDAAEVHAKIEEIANPAFVPAYVKGQRPFTRGRFLRTLAYFRTRAAFFKGLSWALRDPLNLHYLDAQPSHGHKARWRDARIADLVDRDWEKRLEAFAPENRVFLGLQVFPEASIDYWIEDLDLIGHENFIVEIARLCTEAGLQVVVKDHPLQFGFRRTDVLDRLKALTNVVLIPYDVSGNAMLDRCGINVTATGTLGLQSALLGGVSIVGEAYYVVEGDFVVLKSWADLADVPRRIAAARLIPSLRDRQYRIIAHLLRGSFTAEFSTFKNFDRSNPDPSVAELGRRLGAQIEKLGPSGEDWHGKALPAGSGRHPGSPLN
jgi:hypothetical protein